MFPQASRLPRKDPTFEFTPSPALQNLFKIPPPSAGPRGLLRDVDGDGRKTVADLFRVPDTNRNGVMDAGDLIDLPFGAALIRPGEEKVDTPAIIRKILDENPSARIIAIGEDHDFPPLSLVADMVRALRRRGKAVSFALEMAGVPNADYQSNGKRIPVNSPLHAELPRLIERFNRGELPPETFLERLRQEFSTNPFVMALYNAAARKSLLQALETAVRSGADRVYTVDSVLTLGGDENRDRTMAERVANLADRAGPDRVVTGLFGYGHISERPWRNETRPVAVIDSDWPMGRRLASQFGDAYVSVRSFGIADASRDKATRDAAERMSFLRHLSDETFIAPEDLERTFDYSSL